MHFDERLCRSFSHLLFGCLTRYDRFWIEDSFLLILFHFFLSMGVDDDQSHHLTCNWSRIISHNNRFNRDINLGVKTAFFCTLFFVWTIFGVISWLNLILKSVIPFWTGKNLSIRVKNRVIFQLNLCYFVFLKKTKTQLVVVLLVIGKRNKKSIS